MATSLDSPLTHQARPQVFEAKVVGLYRQLFAGGEEEDGESEASFFTIFFLLKPDAAALRQMLDRTDAEFLLHTQHRSQQLLLHALARIKDGEGPADENALDTLAVFFAIVLSKKFVNPSSDVIQVLAGLDNVDSVLFDLVATLDQAIKDGRSTEVRQKAVRTTTAIVAGAYHTALISYFVQKDFFPALMKLVHQLDNPLHAAEPFLLTGLLANYNKFEQPNQYRLRLADFVNEETMARVVHSVAWTAGVLRERYLAIVDDTPVGWSIGAPLTYFGLGALAGVKKPAAPVLTEEQQSELTSQQPGREAAILLTLYDFVLANKLFCHHLISLPAAEKGQAPPFSSLLSFSSYLYQHAYRSVRASSYAYLTLLLLLILVEDPTLMKLLCETSTAVRLCRQRPPQLPLPRGPRPYTVAIIDLIVDCMNHNLRKRLDTNFYRQNITVLSRIISHLAKTRTKLVYHWSELWRSLLSFVRFLTTYADDLRHLPHITDLVTDLTLLLTTSMSSGEAFLPDSAAYDDLFYKLVESGPALEKFRHVYRLAKAEEDGKPINSLIGVSQHYQKLIEANGKGQNVILTPREVNKIIQQGYETLSIETTEGRELHHDRMAERYREVDHRVELKKIARIAVGDAAALVS